MRTTSCFNKKLITLVINFCLIFSGFFTGYAQTIIDHPVPTGATFEYTTTVNVPAGATFVTISAWGGGGGGNGNLQLPSQMIVGGGGGSFSKITKYPVKAGDVLSISVGRGGSVLTSGGFSNTGLNGGNTSVSLNGTTIILACAGPRYYVIAGNYENLSCTPVGQIEAGVKTYTSSGGNAGGISAGGGQGGFPGSDGKVPGGGGGAGVGGQLAGKGASGRVIIDFIQGGETCDVTITPSTPSVCKGDGIDLTASGAASYLWSPAEGLSSTTGSTVKATPTATTTYTVTGTSASGQCTASTTITVNVNQPAKIALTQDPPGIKDLCGGTINLSLPSGYSEILWSDGSNSQSLTLNSQGSYFVKAKDQNGCQSFSDTLTYANSGQPLVTISPASDIFLCVSPVTLTANDGLSEYVWSNGATGRKADIFSPGKYFVTAKNASGCKGKSEEVFVNAAYTLQVSISADKTSLCPGDSVKLSASGSYQNYKWSDGSQKPTLTAKSAGIYSLEVKDLRGCSGVSNQIQVNALDKPVADFSYEITGNTTVKFNNQSLNANSSIWNFGEGNSSQESSPEYIFSQEKIYAVKLKVENECGADSIVKNVNLLKTIIENEKKSEINIYPNPAGDFIFFDSTADPSPDFSIRIYDFIGKKINMDCSILQLQHKRLLNITALPSGTYFLHIQNGNNVYVKRFVRM